MINCSDGRFCVLVNTNFVEKGEDVMSVYFVKSFLKNPDSQGICYYLVAYGLSALYSMLYGFVFCSDMHADVDLLCLQDLL